MFRKLNVQSLPSPILIISPHPDDDILGSAGLIQRARGLGKQWTPVIYRFKPHFVLLVGDLAALFASSAARPLAF
jgi:hypothetical protein